jgi:2-polyprenyl-3-methyl-5-hydroxy-6-metoxy-1,4-benzoquinol methylase
MWHVLEHVPNLYEQIKELKRLLKPSGTLIVAVPNFNLRCKTLRHFWAAYDVPIHFGTFQNDKNTFLKKTCN